MSLNKAILIGNVGKDPVIRYFDNGNAVANFSLATSERGYTLQNGTEVPERTEWHNIVVGRDRARFVEQWVKKGSMVYVEGKIRTRTYDDASGAKRYVTEIYADRIEFFSSGRRPDAAAEGTASTATAAPAASYTANMQAPPTNYPTDNIPPAAADQTDDLPF